MKSSATIWRTLRRRIREVRASLRLFIGWDGRIDNKGRQMLLAMSIGPRSASMETMLQSRRCEDLFPALSRLYKGDDEQAEFCSRLGRLRLEAERAGKKTLATRAFWAESVEWKKRDPVRTQSRLVDLSKRLNVQTDNPILLADCADALLTAGMEWEAESLYRDLIKWNPRAPQKDRALAAIGRIEMKRGNADAALEQFERFEREVVGSRLSGEVMLSRAQLLQNRGQIADARKALEGASRQRICAWKGKGRGTLSYWRHLHE